MVSYTELIQLQKVFRKGRRVRLVSMQDVHATDTGTEGTVINVDDMGTVHVLWDTGQILGCVYDEDRVEIIPNDT